MACRADLEPSAMPQVDGLITQLDEEQRRRVNMDTVVRCRRRAVAGPAITPFFRSYLDYI